LDEDIVIGPASVAANDSKNLAFSCRLQTVMGRRVAEVSLDTNEQFLDAGRGAVMLEVVQRTHRPNECASIATYLYIDDVKEAGFPQSRRNFIYCISTKEGGA